jgi:hypothetical protein
VLLMAFAEDFRLRRLLANPLLAPHVHVVGSRYAILIANLGGLRQAGGSVLVEAFLVLLERIGATTPAWLRKHDKARDGALVLHYLGQLITAIEALNAGIARTATLLPPLAPEGAPATPEPMAVMLRDRWQAVPRGKGTPLDLIAPALLGELDTYFDKLAAAAPGSGSVWKISLAAHDRAYYVAGMLEGWQRFGLPGNTTAHLAQWLRIGQPEPPIYPKPLKPFGEYIVHYKTQTGIGAHSARPDVVLRLDLIRSMAGLTMWCG